MLTAEQKKMIEGLMDSKTKSHFNEALNGFDGTNIVESYTKEMNKSVEKYMADDLYDERQTQVMIGRAADEQGEKYLQQLESKVQDFAFKVAYLTGFTDETIKILDRETVKELEKNSYYYSDLENVIRTKLSLANTAEDIAGVFRKYENDLEGNQALARFLFSKGHLFMDRLYQITGGNPRHQDMTHIHRIINKAEMGAYRPEQKALSEFRKELDMKRHETGDSAKRIFQQYKEGYKTDYKSVLENTRYIAKQKEGNKKVLEERRTFPNRWSRPY